MTEKTAKKAPGPLARGRTRLAARDLISGCAAAGTGLSASRVLQWPRCQAETTASGPPPRCAASVASWPIRSHDRRRPPGVAAIPPPGRRCARVCCVGLTQECRDGSATRAHRKRNSWRRSARCATAVDLRGQPAASGCCESAGPCWARAGSCRGTREGSANRRRPTGRAATNAATSGAAFRLVSLTLGPPSARCCSIRSRVLPRLRSGTRDSRRYRQRVPGSAPRWRDSWRHSTAFGRSLDAVYFVRGRMDCSTSQSWRRVIEEG